jgi:hypothetical protein
MIKFNYFQLMIHVDEPDKRRNETFPFLYLANAAIFNYFLVFSFLSSNNSFGLSLPAKDHMQPAYVVILLLLLVSIGSCNWCVGNFNYKITGSKIHIVSLNSSQIVPTHEESFSLAGSEDCRESFDANEQYLCCLKASEPIVLCWDVSTPSSNFALDFVGTNILEKDYLRISVLAQLIIISHDNMAQVTAYDIAFTAGASSLSIARMVTGNPISYFSKTEDGPFISIFTPSSSNSDVRVGYRNINDFEREISTSSPITGTGISPTARMRQMASSKTTYYALDTESELYTWTRTPSATTFPDFSSATNTPSSNFNMTSGTSTCPYVLVRYYNQPQDFVFTDFISLNTLFSTSLDVSHFAFSSGMLSAPPSRDEPFPSPLTAPSPSDAEMDCLDAEPTPADQFTCINMIWVATTSISTPTVILSGPTGILGNFSTTSLTFNGLSSSINISQCAIINGSITISITEQEYTQIPTGPKVLLYQNCANPSDLSGVPININAPQKACESVSATTQQDSHTGTLTVLFKIDKKPACGKKSNLWWIILASVGGSILLIGAVMTLIFTFNDRARACIRPYSAKRGPER